MEQEALARRNMGQNLHAMFPKLPEQTVYQILQQTGFNWHVSLETASVVLIGFFRQLLGK